MILIDILLLFFAKAICGIINSLPYRFRLFLIEKIIRFLTLFFPDFKKVSYKNLKQVFPHLPLAELDKIYQKNFTELARLFIDTINLPNLDKEWIKQNVLVNKELLASLKTKEPLRPIFYAAGHLGSFPLMAYAVALNGYPLSFVVRNFNLPKVDAWWRSLLELSGNKIIHRKGAVSVLFKKLSEGKDCALLFDQNVKKNYAVFTDWFGQKAATTFALGLSALKSKPHLVIGSMRYIEETKRYEVITELLDCDDIYENQTMSQEDKIMEITQRASNVFQKHILAFPEGWFWMHRRWKTTPEGVEETFYL